MKRKKEEPLMDGLTALDILNISKRNKFFVKKKFANEQRTLSEWKIEFAINKVA